MLNTVTHGQPTALAPLIIAHGLFGSARNWGVIAKRLANERQVIAVDMRNHGNSPWYSSHAYPDLANDLAQVIEGLDQPADVLGHSMGGKAAMILALEKPDLVHRLVVADIAPQAYGHSQNHLIDAMLAIDLNRVERRADASDQFGDVESNLQAFLLQSLDIAEKKWRLNLPVLRAEMDLITGFPSSKGSFAGEALFLTGANSTYVPASSKPAIETMFPSVRFQKIAGAGHWLHAEKPREFETAVREFLNP